MAYFEDHTEYSYLCEPEHVPFHWNIGWLSNEHDYKRGLFPAAAMAALKRFKATNKCAGFHTCDLCPLPPRNCTSLHGYELGNGELHVPGLLGQTFVAPVMIIHYIEKHGYLPPVEFVNALLALAEQASQDTEKSVDAKP